jgi:hypothetical protein
MDMAQLWCEALLERGKSTFLHSQYLVARIRTEARDVLVVRGHSFDSTKLDFYIFLRVGLAGKLPR